MKLWRVCGLSSWAAMSGFCEASPAWTTGPLYRGAIFTAVCSREVVAPPMMTGVRKPAFSISATTCPISSSEGVMSPLSPTKSAFSAMARSTMRSAGTITPRSITSKLLQARMTPTMFLPMSCTSPLTVAMMNLPRFAVSPVRAFSCSMRGCRMATACFMVRALLTTWGRNIFPSPKSWPTRFIPSMRGCSMTAMADPYWATASARSLSRWVDNPLTSACRSRSATGTLVRSCGSVLFGLSASSRCRAAKSMSRSVASGRRFSTTSSMSVSVSAGRSS